MLMVDKCEWNSHEVDRSVLFVCCVVCGGEWQMMRLSAQVHDLSSRLS